MIHAPSLARLPKTPLEPLRMYGRYVLASTRAQLQYPGAFVVAALAQLAFVAIEVAGMWALFARFGQLPRWSLPEVAFFYGFANTAFALANAVTSGFDHFGGTHVKTGDFDRVLLRPRSTLLQLAGHEVSLKRAGRLAIGVGMLGWAATALALPWDAARAAMLAFALLGGVAFFSALMVLQATLAFWTVESLELMNTLTDGGVATAQYPLDIYPRWFRGFFVFVVPLACVLYFPLLPLLGVADPLGSPRALQQLAPLAGFAFLLLACGAWRLGVRRYTSTGS